MDKRRQLPDVINLNQDYYSDTGHGVNKSHLCTLLKHYMVLRLFITTYMTGITSLTRVSIYDEINE